MRRKDASEHDGRNGYEWGDQPDLESRRGHGCDIGYEHAHHHKRQECADYGAEKGEAAGAFDNDIHDAPALCSESNADCAFGLALAFSVALGAEQAKHAEQKGHDCRRAADQDRNAQRGKGGLSQLSVEVWMAAGAGPRPGTLSTRRRRSAAMARFHVEFLSSRVISGGQSCHMGK